ncbi:MAG: hypothetical protein AAFN93_08350 [Bacteroidota bacterium]
MKDEKLDKIFQDASQGIDFGDGANAWNDMKSKLKAEGVVVPESNHKKGFRWTSLLLILLLIIGTGLIWNYTINTNETLNESVVDNKNSSTEVNGDLADGSNGSASINTQNDDEQISQTESVISSSVEEVTTDKGELDKKYIANIDQDADVATSQGVEASTSYDDLEITESGAASSINDDSQSSKNGLEAGMVPVIDAEASLDEAENSVKSRRANGLKKSNANNRSKETDTVDEDAAELKIVKSEQRDVDKFEKADRLTESKTEESERVASLFTDGTNEGISESESSITTNNATELITGQKKQLENQKMTEELSDGKDQVNDSLVAKKDRPLSHLQVVSSLPEAADNGSPANDKNSEEALLLSKKKSNYLSQQAEKEELFVTGEQNTDSKKSEEVTTYVASPGFLEGKEFVPFDIKSSLFSPIIESDRLAEFQSSLDTQSEIRAKRSKWSIGLEFSPDLSGASLGRVEDTGFNLGLNVEYHLTSKFSVNSGLVYAKKIYYADQNIESYNRNPNWVIDRVDAVCDVIDIPINLNYYIAGRERSGFLLSAGLSTYIMLTEDYDISYERPSIERQWSIRNENDHFFGIFNASVGYKKILSPTMSLQAEPFVKIPLEGIGEGELDLFTSGLRLILKYNRIRIIK